MAAFPDVGDIVHNAAWGWDEAGRETESAIVEFSGGQAWIGTLSKIPVKGLALSYPMKLYHSNDKNPFSQENIANNYADYDFTGDQLFYKVKLFPNLHLAGKPRLNNEQITQLLNKFGLIENNLNRKNKNTGKYIIKFAEWLDNQQGILPPPPPAPVAPLEEQNDEGGPNNIQPVNEDPQNPLGGFRRKSKKKTNKRKLSKRKNKKTRKH